MADFKFKNRLAIDQKVTEIGLKTNAPLPFKELHSDDPLHLDPVKFTDKLFNSERHTFTCLKAIIGIVCGLFCGGILFLLLVYSFSYAYDLAGYIAIGCTVLSCIALASSVHARCIGVLMIPSLFTGRGRVAILAIIFGLLLSRPVKNISENASEVSRSMACSTELFHNQSLSLRQQLQIPIDQIKEALGDQAEDIKKLGRAIESAVQPLYNAINAVKNGVQLVSGALDTASQECNRVLGGVYSDCVREITSAYRSCTKTLNDVKKYVPGLDLTAICKILDVEEVCVVVKANVLCSPVNVLDDAAEKLAESMVKLVDGINKWFQFDIVSKAAFDNVYNASKTTKELIAEVEAALTERKVTMTYVFDILNKLLALSLLLILTQSFFYLKNYLAKDEFDNIYITTKFKQTEEENRNNGKEVVLPLQKKEKKLYIDSNSPKMTAKERKQSILGIAQIFLHMLLSALVIFLNYVLYYVLYLVNRYGHVDVEITGESKINLQVTGGQMANFINTFLNNINIENTYEANYNTTICLPNPTAPDATDIPVLLGAYVAALILVFLQAYGARFNRKICAFYYQEQEEVRIMFLKKKILYNRKKRRTFMRQHVKSMTQQKLTEEKMSFKHMLAAACPCFKSSLVQPQQGFCMNCGGYASASRKLEACKNASCEAVYCTECFNEFKQICPVCRK